LEGVVALVNDVFRHQGPPIIQQEFPQLFSPENAHSLYIMLEDGVPVSHIGVYEQHMHIGPVTLPVGCIGAVGTRSDRRGQGYAGATLACAIHTMRSHGVLLMPVSGRRSLYSRAGCATVGRSYGQKRTLEELAPLARDRYRVVCWNERYLSALEALHQLEPVRYHWPAEELGMLMEENLATSSSAFVALSGRELAAWVLIRHFGPMAHYSEGAGRLIDSVGVREAVWSAAVGGMKALGLAQLQFAVPFSDVTSLELLKAESLAGEPGGIGGTYKVLDLTGLVEALTPYFHERLTLDEQVDFSIDSAGVVEDEQFISDRIRFAFRSEEFLAADPLVATQVIFSPMEDWKAKVAPVPKKLARVLARVFPVPLPPYGINYI
jgi:GNAT superfamily N-acetyltransferase